ncbi:MAG: hypothetical protein LBK65_05260, partial [Tannerellaceae bacterium]|nr:hypothetical protein [Tannerellaceae bacterium]
SCTDNLIYTRCESQSERTVPGDLPDRLTDNRSRLQAPIYKHRYTGAGRQKYRRPAGDRATHCLILHQSGASSE